MMSLLAPLGLLVSATDATNGFYYAVRWWIHNVPAFLGMLKGSEHRFMVGWVQS